MAKKHNNRRGSFLIILCLLVIVGGIVYLKSASHKPTDSSTPVAADSLNGPMAVPDTTIAPDVLPDVSDTLSAVAVTDSLGRDPRPADEAGAEDGYWDGYYDGVAGKAMNEHDVSSRFPTRKEREDYAANYADGYARGYEEGSNSKNNAE